MGENVARWWVIVILNVSGSDVEESSVTVVSNNRTPISTIFWHVPKEQYIVFILFIGAGLGHIWMPLRCFRHVAERTLSHTDTCAMP